MIAQATVHTSGVNWESVSVIAGVIVATMAFFVGVVNRRSDAVRGEIKEAVDHLSEVLVGKLETKDAVNSLAQRVTRIEANTDRWVASQSSVPVHQVSEVPEGMYRGRRGGIQY
jgi:hypothetical protein